MPRAFRWRLATTTSTPTHKLISQWLMSQLASNFLCDWATHIQCELRLLEPFTATINAPEQPLDPLVKAVDVRQFSDAQSGDTMTTSDHISWTRWDESVCERVVRVVVVDWVLVLLIGLLLCLVHAAPM